MDSSDHIATPHPGVTRTHDALPLRPFYIQHTAICNFAWAVSAFLQ